MLIHIIKGDSHTDLEYDKPVLLSTVFADNGIRVEMPCGGKQRCLKCRVRAEGELSPLTLREQEILTEEEKQAGIRFACMAYAQGDVTVYLPEDKVSDRIVTSGNMPAFPLQPWAAGYGAAVDIGTTTVALYVYRLADGFLMGTASERNPQAIFGADVISRIEKSLAGEGEALARSIRECLVRMLQAACKQGHIEMAAVSAMVLTGNTAMLYLLCGQNPASIAAAPFQQDRYFGEFLPASSLDMPVSPKARIYLPRCMSAYVGADITTALMAAEFDNKVGQSDRPAELLVDIGTNGEMALVAGGRLLCCSTAAGPAFEGAGIYMGMNAKEGAISKVSLTDGDMQVSVIGGGEAKGICGSGIVDAVAAMVSAGIIEESGLLLEEEHAFESQMTEADGQVAFRIPHTDVVITQKDIRSIQLAKSAICSGMTTLIAEAGLKPEDVTRLYIAGGFGAFIDVQSAERIGLIPAGFAAKSQAIGNAAGAGATMTLLSEDMRQRSEWLAKESETVELSSSPLFMDAYVDNMMFL